MSADIYADNARQIQAKIGAQAQSKISDIDSMASNLTDSFNKTISNYSAKWNEVQQIGTAGVTTPLALRGVRAAVNKFRSVKAAGNARNAARAKASPGSDNGENDTGDTPAANDTQTPTPSGGDDPPAPAADDGGDGGDPDAIRPAPQQQVSPGGEDDDQQNFDRADLGDDGGQPFQRPTTANFADPDALEEQSNGIFNDAADALKQRFGSVGRSITQQVGKVTSYFKGGSSGVADATTAATGAGEGGGELGAFTLTELGAGAIPVLGEAALAVGGLVALGEGIAHLFDKPSAPKGPSVVIPNQAPASLTTKYADALPSADSAVDRSGGSSAF